jgi:hypothetical protein
VTSAPVERNGQCDTTRDRALMMAGNGYTPHVRLRGNNRLVFKVSTELHEACDTEAQRRHLSLNALLRLILSKTVEGKLFSAIIDDGR